MNDVDELDVSRTVDMLGASRPAVLAAIRKNYPDPDSRAVLTPGGHVLGGAGPGPAEAASRALLGELDSICLDVTLAVRRRLSAANMLEFWGKLIAASSSGGLVVRLLGSGRPGTTDLALAGVSFVATALPLAVATIRRGIGTDGDDLAAKYDRLRDLCFEARKCRSRFDSAPSGANLKKLIQDTEELVGKVWPLLIDLGWNPNGGGKAI